MAGEGVELLADLSELAIMGFAEVLRHLPRILRLERRVNAALVAENVGLVVPIDYPGFNLRLARRARREGRAVLWYIAPQVWAWHASRAGALARDASEVAVVLPFEVPFLTSHGVRARFVGHPLLDSDVAQEPHESWARKWNLDPGRPVLALFPGSREQEVKRHLRLFVAAAERVSERRPNVQTVLAASADLDASIYGNAALPRIPAASGLLAHATAALVKSGTTTLEAALAGTPLVVAYRTSGLTYAVARRVVRVPHIALANLVAGERVAPEFIQDAATPDTLADALLPLLDPESQERTRMQAGLAGIRSALGTPGAAGRVADMAAELLARA